MPSASVSNAQIGQAYQTLFNFANRSSVDAKIADIQGGSTIRTSLTQALQSPLASAAQGASVGAITQLSDSKCSSSNVPSPCAAVTYSILGSGGSALLANQAGYASYSTGKWLVAKVTICKLLQLFYSANGNNGTPPGC